MTTRPCPTRDDVKNLVVFADSLRGRGVVTIGPANLTCQMLFRFIFLADQKLEELAEAANSDQEKGGAA